MRTIILILGTAAGLAGEAASAQQAQLRACDAQQKLEQVLQSDGRFQPDGCRMITVTRVRSDAGDFCIVDLGADSSGIIGGLREAATTTRWWMKCDELKAP